MGVEKGSPHAFFTAMQTLTCTAPTARTVLTSVGMFDSPQNPNTCSARVTLAKSPILRQSPYAGMLVNGAGRPVDLDGLPPTLPATMGGNKTPIVDQQALLDASRTNWFADYHTKPVSGQCLPASMPVPSYIRRLTLKEAAAIQTFPDHYGFCGTKSKQYRQIGNAVPSLFAYKVASAIRKAYPSYFG